MTDRDIIKDVRDAREAFASRHAFDIGRMVDELKRVASTSGFRVVTLSPRQPVRTTVAVSSTATNGKSTESSRLVAP